MNFDRTLAFSDGAASGNPGPGGWAAILLSPDGHVTEVGGGDPHTTNNRMELTGAIRALAHADPARGPVAVYTDSTYVIRGIREWIWNWKRRGWKTAEGADVLNRDLWEVLLAEVTRHGKDRVEWHYVRGHVGTPGNERCDEIAVAFSRNKAKDAQLYFGPLIGYSRPLLDLPEDTALPARTSKGAGKKAPAHSYLSLIDGTPMRHATWAECERRVKGQSGARFKKAASASHELEILREWQVDPRALKK
jgi:ribonuclease HI